MGISNKAHWPLLFISLMLSLTIHTHNAQAESKASGTRRLTLIYSPNQPAPVTYAIEKLKQSLSARGVSVSELNSIPDKVRGETIFIEVAGLNSLVKSLINEPPVEPEALLIKRSPKYSTPFLVVTGADEVGTMYALLELVAQIDALPPGANVVSSISEISEKPYARERSLSTYLYSEQVRKGFFHDPEYWDKLFEQVANSRLNSYDLILKFTPPIYTLFFNVDGWTTKEVGGIDASPEEQSRNLASLQSIVKKAHDHGVKITIGIWNHVRNPEDAERISPYTEAAIAKLIQLVPFDAFQFRMHWESGLPRDEKTLNEFWGRVFDGINLSGRKIKIYPRAKGLPDSVIEIALRKGMDIAIETKYSAEQLGMPFHPAHIQPANQRDRRHGYADLLSYPKRYDMLYRLWNGGSQRLLVWGDTDYARRWVESTMLYNSGIFEVMELEGAEPMGNGSERALNKEYVYTDYEFQRYWCQNMMFGRLGYNPETDDEVFLREFRKRFGSEAGPIVMDALAYASRIIPRITGSAMPDFQEQRGVPEWGSGSGLNGKAMLSAYAKIKPSDVQTFLSFEEAAALMAIGGESARVWPQENAEWFSRTASEITSLVARAEGVTDANRTKEFDATMTDLRILASMARFHSERIKAALAYNIFLILDRSRPALDSAISYEVKALNAYRGAVEAANDYYRTDLDISLSDAGHWQGELVLLENAFAELQKTATTNSKPMPRVNFHNTSDHSPPVVVHTIVTDAKPGKTINIVANISDPSGVKWARVLYRGVTQFQNYQVAEMKREGDLFTAVIPAEKVDEVTEYVPETGAKWDFMYLIEAMDNLKNGCIFPDFEQTSPYVFVRLPHKSLAETGGRIAPPLPNSLIPGSSENTPSFKIIQPTDGDVYDSGADVKIKLERQYGQKEEIVKLYINDQEIMAEETGKMEYIIKGLKNGTYNIKARLTSEGLLIWSNSVEIVVGSSRNTGDLK